MNKPAQLELVGRKIRQLRRQRKLTQVELADRIGLSKAPCWRRISAAIDTGSVSGPASTETTSNPPAVSSS